jgi:hypothetical protein
VAPILTLLRRLEAGVDLIQCGLQFDDLLPMVLHDTPVAARKRFQIGKTPRQIGDFLPQGWRLASRGTLAHDIWLSRTRAENWLEILRPTERQCTPFVKPSQPVVPFLSI